MKVKKILSSGKLLTLMKIGFTQIMIAFVICGVSMAHDNLAQVLDKEVSIDATNVPLEHVLNDLSGQADIKFAYGVDRINLKKLVSIKAEQRPLREVLNELLAPLSIRYKVHEREGIIALKRQQNETDDPSALPQSSPIQRSAKPLIQITGRVTSLQGEPMAGVNVVVKGTTNGTSTDSDGRYVINAEASDVIVFSFIGYTSVEINVSTQTSIDVVLQEDVKSLGEVVVNAGYWEVREKEQTGTIGRVTSKEINKQPVSNPLLAIQGRVPGVVITPVNGIAGGAQTVQIRGQNSLRPDGNYPLYIVDGVPIDSRPIASLSTMFIGGMDPISTINPENIESIEVLKDADATSVYGSRGANGVILITTKKGKKGMNDVDIQAYMGSGRVSRKMKVMSTQQYLAMRNEAFVNDGPGALANLNNPANAMSYPELKVWDQNRNTDWQDELFGSTAGIADIQGAVSAGNASTSFRLGGSFHQESTVFPGDFRYRKATANVNLNHASEDNRFTLLLAFNYGADNNKLFSGNYVYTALTLAPNAPGYDDQGNIDWTGYRASLPNPYSFMEINHQAKTKNLIASTKFGYEILSGLNILMNLGYTDMRTDENVNTPLSSMVPGTASPSNSTFGDRSLTSWIVEPQATFQKNISKGRLDALIGTTWQSSASNNEWLRGVGYVSDELLGNINAASQIIKMSADQTSYRYNALFGRMGFNWSEKYYINLTARRDGSSRFGPDSRFANFGAIGVAWILSNEQWLKNFTNLISFAKLRGSHGTSGNDQIGDYGYLSTYNTSSVNYQGTAVLTPGTIGNPEYAWEVNRKHEVALDLGFWDDRLMLNVGYYNNYSSNQLVGYPLPAMAGFTTVQANLDATVRNYGWEMALSSTNLKADNWKWTTSFNLTIPRNKLSSYPNIAGSAYAHTYVVGQPLTIVKVYHATGVNPETGLYTFEDIDGNGTINTQDRNTVINIGRDFYGGVSSSLTFKNFQFDFFLEYVKQNVRSYMGTFLQTPGSSMNQPEFIARIARWRAPGDNAEIQRFTTNSTVYNLARTSDLNVDDGSYLRMKTVALSYKVPEKWAKKIAMKDITAFVHGQNLFVITPYKGLDPEIPGNSQLPQLRIITGGISLKI
jgi:TonB-dependent starch-binding outer membrane protein SusC